LSQTRQTSFGAEHILVAEKNSRTWSRSI
jgi:hypothetical protein